MNSSKRPLRTAVWLALALSAGRAAAAADDPTSSTARDLALEGRSAYAAGDYARARELFHRAHELIGAPTLSIYEARSLAHLGRLVEAVALYRKTVETPLDARAPEQFHRAVADAVRELAELEPRLPTLSMVLRGASAGDRRVEVRLDGAPADAAVLARPVPLDPGPHRVEVWLDGRSADARTLTLAEGEHPSVELAVGPVTPAIREGAKPAPAPPTSVQQSGHGWQRTLVYVSLGVAGAGIGTGVVTGLLASAKHSDALRECPDNRCAAGSAGSRDVDSFRDLRLASTIGYAVGVVAAVGGVTLLLIAPPRDAHPTTGALEVWLGPRRAGVRGTFW